MIRPTDETPEQRRAAAREDLEAEVQAKIAAMTDEQINEGLQLAIRLLAHQGNMPALLAVTAAIRRVSDLKEQVARLKDDAEHVYWDKLEALNKAEIAGDV